MALGGRAALFLGGIRLREFLLQPRAVQCGAQGVQLLNRDRGHRRSKSQVGKFRDRENRAQVLPFLPAGMHCLADKAEEPLPVERTWD